MKNRCPRAKSATYLQRIMLYFAETELDEIEDHGEDSIFYTLSSTVPYQKLWIEPTFDPSSFSPETPLTLIRWAEDVYVLVLFEGK